MTAVEFEVDAAIVNSVLRADQSTCFSSGLTGPFGSPIGSDTRTMHWKLNQDMF